jgi:hypothetical protein
MPCRLTPMSATGHGTNLGLFAGDRPTLIICIEGALACEDGALLQVLCVPNRKNFFRCRIPSRPIQDLLGSRPAIRPTCRDISVASTVRAENLRHLVRCFAGRRRLGHGNGAWRARSGSGWRAMTFGLWA